MQPGLIRTKTRITGVMIIAIIAVGICGPVFPSEQNQSQYLRIAYLSQDPPSIDPLAPAFDPDSYSVIAQIFDPLVYLDFSGHVQPALATKWHQLSDTRWLFELRKGVYFQNGEPFNADAVKFTLDYVLDPANHAGTAWILNSIKRIEKVKGNGWQVIIETHFPDAMLLNRLHLFSSICPPRYIKEKGIDYFRQHPIGTGPYQFAHWQKGKQILLNRNKRDWNSDRGFIEHLAFEIMPAKKWRSAFEKGEVDFIPNLSGTDTSLLMSNRSENKVRILKKTVLMSYWVLLRNQGMLANESVRKALNYAVNKNDLVSFADQGNSVPQASLGKIGEFGRAPDLKPYPFDPKRAISLLRSANAPEPLRLKALVADVATKPAKIIKAQLKRVGVDVSMEFVSRSEWARRIVGYKITHGSPADYDMAINMVDNPIYNLAFHAGLFLQSSSPWSLLNDASFDQSFGQALRVANSEQQEIKLQQLDRLIYDKALLLFTTQRKITAAVNPALNITDFAGNGHLGYNTLSQARWKTGNE